MTEWAPVARLGPVSGPNGPTAKEVAMATFMDVHSGFFGVTAEQLAEAHGRDLAIEADEGVHFATGPSRESVLRIHERAGHATAEIYELPVEV
jgi:hypothetical protein